MSLRRVPVDARTLDWPRRVADAIRQLQEASTGSNNMKDDSNSSTTPLGSGATYTGEWVSNTATQIAFNCLTDQDGELFLEFSIDGTDALKTLSKRFEVFANQGEFDALVKMPGRFHRVRYVNGATAQTKFGLITSTADDGLFPFALSNRDSPKFAAVNGSSINATQYQILVDLSDRTTYPHSKTGGVNINSAFLFCDRASDTVGDVRIGVITRIDGTDADVTYVQGVSFANGSDRVITRDRIFETPLFCKVDGGSLTGNASAFSIPNVAAINTATPLTTFAGTATPAVGDIIARFAYTSGAAYDAAVSIQYSTES